MTTVQAVYNSLLDQNGKQLPILSITGTTVLAFNGVSAKVALPANVGTTTTGWVLSFTATQDCWIKFGTTAAQPTAASDTADNIFIKAGAIVGPVYMGSYDYVAAIRDAAAAVDGTLCIYEHTYTV